MIIGMASAANANKNVGYKNCISYLFRLLVSSYLFLVIVFWRTNHDTASSYLLNNWNFDSICHTSNLKPVTRNLIYLSKLTEGKCNKIRELCPIIMPYPVKAPHRRFPQYHQWLFCHAHFLQERYNLRWDHAQKKADNPLQGLPEANGPFLP